MDNKQLQQKIAELEGYETRIANVDSPIGYTWHGVLHGSIITGGIQAQPALTVFKEGDLVIRPRLTLGSAWQQCPIQWQNPQWVLDKMQELYDNGFRVLGDFTQQGYWIAKSDYKHTADWLNVEFAFNSDKWDKEPLPIIIAHAWVAMKEGK